MNYSVDNPQRKEIGLIIEFLPTTANNWLRTFKPGESNYSAVYQHPDKNNLIIISYGKAYIINPGNKQLLETFGNQITDLIYIPKSLTSDYYILLINNSNLLCYDSSGFQWQNNQIRWNKIRKIEVSGYELKGEFYSLKEYSWKKFSLNIIKNALEWKKFVGESKCPWWKFW